MTTERERPSTRVAGIVVMPTAITLSRQADRGRYARARAGKGRAEDGQSAGKRQHPHLPLAGRSKLACEFREGVFRWRVRWRGWGKVCAGSPLPNFALAWQRSTSPQGGGGEAIPTPVSQTGGRGALAHHFAAPKSPSRRLPAAPRGSPHRAGPSPPASRRRDRAPARCRKRRGGFSRRASRRRAA